MDEIIPEFKTMVSNSTDRIFGKLIIVPQVDMFQRVKCVSSTGEESFTYPIKGRIFLDIDDVEDVTQEGEEVVIWVK